MTASQMRVRAVVSSAALLAGVAVSTCSGAEATTAGRLQTAASATAPAFAPAALRPTPPLRYGIFKFSNYPAAWTAAQSSNRPILIFATAPNCPHCVRMVGESLRAPQVKRFLNDSFETVYADRFEQPELAARLGVRRFPTTVIVGPDNEVIDVIEGYVDARTLAARLQTSCAAQQSATQTR